MPLSIEWIGDLRHIASDDAGHSVIVESQGVKSPLGFSATRLLLIAAASCMSNHLVEVLNKKRLAIRRIHILADGQRAEQHPKRFISISLIFRVAADIDKDTLQGLLLMIKDKYCSVLNSLDPKIEVKIEGQVIEEG